MKKIFYDRFSMVKGVNDFLNEHQTTITGIIPATAGMITQLNNLMTDLINVLPLTTSRITGYALDKQSRRDALMNETFSVGNAVALYYTFVVPDELLRQRVTFTKSFLRNLAGSNLLVRAREVHETAEPIKTLLAPYAVSAARVDGLKTIMDSYFDKFSSPEEKRKEVMNASKKAVALLQQVDALLKNQMDLVIGNIEPQHRELYFEYKLLRRINNSPVNKTVKKSTVLPGEVKYINYRKDFLQAETKLTLHNDSARTKGNPLQFYFAARKNDKPKAEQPVIIINPADEKTITATEAGFSAETPLLHVFNPGKVKVRWRVRVEVIH